MRACLCCRGKARGARLQGLHTGTGRGEAARGLVHVMVPAGAALSHAGPSPGQAAARQCGGGAGWGWDRGSWEKVVGQWDSPPEPPWCWAQVPRHLQAPPQHMLQALVHHPPAATPLSSQDINTGAWGAQAQGQVLIQPPWGQGQGPRPGLPYFSACRVSPAKHLSSIHVKC